MHGQSSRRQSTRRIALAVALALGSELCHAAGPAGIRVDGTLGGSPKTLAGPVYNITQGLGKLSGSNLFHSFQYFNVGAGETALFSTTTPGIGNIIARVTGGFASTIAGTLSVQAVGSLPNLFLMNPAGVTFTASSVIDVPAAFHVTTADYLNFSHGNFYADSSKQSTFSSAAPTAFGFLGDKKASVLVQGPFLSAGSGGHGQFDIVAGDIGISANPQIGAGIGNSSGAIRMTAVGAQAVEVPLSGSVVTTDGAIVMQPGAEVYTVGPPGEKAGAIELNAGTISVDGAGAVVPSGAVSIAGDAGAGPIMLNAGSAITLSNGAGAYSESSPGGTGADISVKTPSFRISGAGSFPTGLRAETQQSAGGGSVFVDVGALTIVGMSQLDSSTTGILTHSTSSGAPGSIEVSASGALSVQDGGYIKSTALSAAPRSGDVTVNAGSITLSSMGSATTQIDSALDDAASGKAGAVTISSQGGLKLIGNANIFSNSNGAADAGPVTIAAGSLSLLGGTGSPGASISSIAGNVFTFPEGNTVAGNAGDVTVAVRGPIELAGDASINTVSFGSGNAGNISIKGMSLTMNGVGQGTQTTIQTNSFGNGRGANLDIDIDGPITMSGSGPPNSAGDLGRILIEGSAYGNGIPSTLSIKAQSLTIDNTGYSQTAGVGISASNYGSSSGAPLSIEVSGALTMKNGAQVVTGALGEGSSGTLEIKAGALTLDGGPQGILTQIQTTSFLGSPGNAGAISIVTSGAVLLENDGRITSESNSSGNAGSITLAAGSLTINGGVEIYPLLGHGIPPVTAISSVATGTTGSAGSVSVTVAGDVSLTDGGRIDSGTEVAGNAGNVAITAGGTLAVGGGRKTSSISSQASNISQGQPGSVSITANNIDVSNLGLVTIQDDRRVEGTGPSGSHRLNVSTHDLTMDGGAITAASSGPNDASSIDVQYSGSTARLTNAVITTSAATGNGGTITITGDGTLRLDRSQITTSVTGSGATASSAKNGGDIDIAAPLIVMNTAAIQANTLVPLSSGGEINVRADAIIPSFQSFILGGTLQSFDPSLAGMNFIQAVAPDGVNGVLSVTIPTLDLGTALLGLTGRLASAPALARRACGYTRGSTLAPSGRGGLPTNSADLLYAEEGEAARVAGAGADTLDSRGWVALATECR